MMFIPLQAIPAQSFTVTLGGQSVLIAVYQKSNYIYCDITSNGTPVRQGRMALNGVRLVRLAYLGFIGDLVFMDMQGATDPVYTGLGTRYQLVYLTPYDLSAEGFDA